MPILPSKKKDNSKQRLNAAVEGLNHVSIDMNLMKRTFKDEIKNNVNEILAPFNEKIDTLKAENKVLLEKIENCIDLTYEMDNENQLLKNNNKSLMAQIEKLEGKVESNQEIFKEKIAQLENTVANLQVDKRILRESHSFPFNPNAETFKPSAPSIDLYNQTIKDKSAATASRRGGTSASRGGGGVAA